MAKEILTIPTLPSADPDFVSYIQDASIGAFSPEELRVRFAAQGGYARIDGLIATIMADGSIEGRQEAGRGAIEEDRKIGAATQESVAKVNEKVRTNELSSQTLANTESYLRDIIDGVVRSDELEARFACFGGFARIGSDIACRRADDTIGAQAQPDNSAISERRATLTNGQKELLSVVAIKLDQAMERRTTLATTASFVQDACSNTFNANELEARFSNAGGYARVDGLIATRMADGTIEGREEAGQGSISENRGQLTDNQQAAVRILFESSAKRQEKYAAALVDTVVTKIMMPDMTSAILADETGFAEDSQVLADAQRLLDLRYKVCDAEIDSLIVSLFEDGDESRVLDLLAARGANVADLIDEESISASQKNIVEYVRTARQLAFRSRFWRTVRDNFNEGQAEQIVDDFKPLDDDDRELAKELRREICLLVRDTTTAKIYQELSRDLPNYEAVAEQLKTVEKATNKLRGKASKELLYAVAFDAYQSEVFQTFAQRYQQLTLQPEKLEELLDGTKNIAVRKAIDGVEYFDIYQTEVDDFTNVVEGLTLLGFEKELVRLRRRFITDVNVRSLVQDILDFPGDDIQDSQLRQGLLNELALIVSSRRGIDPERFSQLEELELESLRAARVPESKLDLLETPERRNIAALRNLTRRFRQSLMPLFEAIRGSDSDDSLVQDFIRAGENAPRDKYTQKIERLEEQRELTDIERAYLESVELLSLFNPHLIALAKERPELTSLYLEAYFKDLSRQTAERITDDIYVPNIQIGVGPEGAAAAGELNRVNPEMARDTLYIDLAKVPGGPFGVPLGLAWLLNSASGTGPTTNILQDLTELDIQGRTVRAYGSPLVAYPGERIDGQDVRRGSINASVDYLLTADNVSTRRYPSNVDEARVIQLQMAMLADHMLLETEVLRSEPVNDGKPGNKRLTIAITNPETGDVQIRTVRTDNVTLASGLGQEGYGFDLAGTEAEKIIVANNTAPNGFPRISTFLQSLEAVSRPVEPRLAPQGTVVIPGGGNSSDVVLQNLGRQLDTNNPMLSGIDKIVVLSTGQPSERPRYFEIIDLKSRNGQPNFIEVVEARLGDIKLRDDGRLEFVDNNGQPIYVGSNGGTTKLVADHVIATTGFIPMTDAIFRSQLAKNESIDKKQNLDKVRLPNNPNFTIANRLSNDKDVLIVGTASEADFENPNKLAQLPAKSREALIRNGKANAVAIGFRATDARAAVRLQYTGKTASETELELRPRKAKIDGTEVTSSQVTKAIKIDTKKLPELRQNIDADSETLTALFLGSLPVVSIAGQSTQANGMYTFQVSLGDEQDELVMITPSGTPKGLQQMVRRSIAQPYFQAYALQSLKKRRNAKGLTIALSFSNGKLRLRDNSTADDTRTFVEVN